MGLINRIILLIKKPPKSYDERILKNSQRIAELQKLRREANIELDKLNSPTKNDSWFEINQKSRSLDKPYQCFVPRKISIVQTMQDLLNKRISEKREKEILEKQRIRLEQRKQEQEKAQNKLKDDAEKDDAEIILNYLRKNGVRYFYHFTDVRNIDSIRKKGGLFSWKYCDNNNISIPNAGGDDSSRRLDTKNQLEDYVRLSFCVDHPMAYRIHKAGAKIVLLKVKIEVAALYDTQFSDINATDNNVSYGRTFKDLCKVDIQATKRRCVSKQDEDFKLHQAECMVKTHIPSKYIVNLDNPELVKFS